MSFARERQRTIYSSGMSGLLPRVPVDYDRLRAAARRVLSAEAFAYIEGGAGHEQTLDQNREAFRRLRVIPRMLAGVERVNTSVTLFSQQLPAPFLMAPIGVLELAHAQADRAVAGAAAGQGIPMVFSNQASVSMEECAAVMGQAPRYFQLYWSKNNDLVASLVTRAEAAGCSAIVVTLDTTLLGWRPRDLDLGYLPFLRGMGIAQYTSDPVFQRMVNNPTLLGEPAARPRLTVTTLKNLVSLLRRYPGGFIENLASGRALRGVQTFIHTYSRPSLSWEDLPFLRSVTRLPILLKGILHPDDARRAVDSGVDGIIVSNHGGRQIDGALPAIEALPNVVSAVGPDLPILLDSGIRGGADAFKALALGATAVLIGRPYVYALAIAGQQGVDELLAHYRAEFELTMALAGCSHIGDIHSDFLRSGPL